MTKNKEIKLARTTPKNLAKRYTKAEAKDIIRSLSNDPDNILETITKLVQQYRNSNKRDQNALFPELFQKLKQGEFALGLETHRPLAETVSKQYEPMVIGFAQQLVKEYRCNTPSEKALAQVIAGAYARIIQYSMVFNNSCTRMGFLTSEKVGFYNMISKEIDRAQRHFISSFVTLKQLKSPNIELNVKAKTAFVSQNQQINAFINPSGQQGENNEPK